MEKNEKDLIHGTGTDQEAKDIKPDPLTPPEQPPAPPEQPPAPAAKTKTKTVRLRGTESEKKGKHIAWTDSGPIFFEDGEGKVDADKVKSLKEQGIIE